MSYAIVESQRDQTAVVILCRALGVSVNGYYARRSRGASQRQQQDEQLLRHIQQVYRIVGS